MSNPDSVLGATDNLVDNVTTNPPELEPRATLLTQINAPSTISPGGDGESSHLLDGQKLKGGGNASRKSDGPFLGKRGGADI